MKLQQKKYTIFDYITIPFGISKLHTILNIALKFIEAVIPSCLVVCTASFVDTTMKIISGSSKRQIIIPLLEILILVSSGWLLSILRSFSFLKLKLKVSEWFKPFIIERRSHLKYKYIEDNVIWDLITRVGNQPEEQIMNGFQNLLEVAFYSIQTIGLISIVFFQVWWVSICIMLITIPLFFLAIKSGAVSYDAWKEIQVHHRKAQYFKHMLTSRESALERTIFNYGQAINEKWLELSSIARTLEYKANRYNFFRMKIGSSIVIILSISIAFLLLLPVRNRQITAGMYMSLVTASFQLVQQVSWQFSVVIEQFIKNKCYMEDVTKFLSLEIIENKKDDVMVAKKDNNTNKIVNRIEFRNVSFTYPKTKKRVISGLSMELERGKQYAIVGENGCGKSTIIKLLTGMYQDYEGEILIDGVDVKTMSPMEIRKLFAVVYQDFSKYEISVRDNISLGTLQNQTEISDEEIINALNKVGLEELLEKLPNGLDTKLGKLWEENSDISIGQWQRIAIARNLVNQAPIHIFDEPTAALDPINECKLYQLFQAVNKKYLNITITHRLGSAKLADEIIVMREGHVVEQGNHNMLLKKNGYYAQMFETQRGWYENE